MADCNVNKWGWVSHRIPFQHSWDAKAWAKMSGREDDSEYNPVLAKVLAEEISTEINRLIKIIVAKTDDSSKQIRALADSRDALRTKERRSILDKVKEEMATDKINELLGYHHALTDVSIMLMDRKRELFDLERMRIDDSK